MIEPDENVDPNLGRFISSDSIGVWGDSNSLGNGYAYVGNMGAWAVDPGGTHAYARYMEWNIPRIDGAGTMRFEFFIEAPMVRGFKGDARQFSDANNDKDSRAAIELDFASGRAYARISPSCKDDGKCFSAYPLKLDGPKYKHNYLSIQSFGDVVRIDGELGNSAARYYCEIDFAIEIEAQADGATVAVSQDAYPSLEASYNGRNFAQMRETLPEALCGPDDERSWGTRVGW